ncbi:PREDICTED: lipoyltransferase 1, mitochondrial-like [Nicrophorus vespilloides]|uniref:Lipoyltransferase 1, mitochondrial-like n=1 Tax=Nicrophorus vespilloides TaxID=110193 RepID=A0ABM1N637_NICVS|nr:PREDICTED: lipoyltransferase 1, mitochondrial-like [Nicrophorus vespilloides]
MAFVQRNILRSASKFQQIIRPLSGGAAQKSVFISQSNDVYTNLALEEWIKSNYDLKKDNIMLYYKNDPCIQIGQAANPWLETNISFHHENDNVLPVARRQGQASTVYQDNGAMNLTIFGRSTAPNDIIARALFRRYGLIVNKHQDDLRFFNHKISANQFADGEDYQHCSLFVDVNQGDSVGALAKQKLTDEKKFVNITQIDPKVTMDGLLSAIGWEFLRFDSETVKDGGMQLAKKQNGFQMINPSENWFPGITEIRNRLASWDWCYGSTPKFTILRSFPVPAQLLNPSSETSNELHVKVEVNTGKISDVTLFVPPGLTSSGFTGEAKVVTSLRGQKFSEAAINSFESILGVNNNEKEKFVTDCVREAVCSV